MTKMRLPARGGEKLATMAVANPRGTDLPVRLSGCSPPAGLCLGVEWLAGGLDGPLGDWFACWCFEMQVFAGLCLGVEC